MQTSIKKSSLLLIPYSLLLITSNMVGIAQLVRASGCGPEGRGFESHYSPQKIPYTKVCGIFTFYLFTLHFHLIGVYGILGKK